MFSNIMSSLKGKTFIMHCDKILCLHEGVLRQLKNWFLKVGLEGEEELERVRRMNFVPKNSKASAVMIFVGVEIL